MLFIFLILAFTYGQISNKCSEKIDQILSNLDFSSILVNSGKNINDLGDYEECQRDIKSHYLLAILKLKSSKLKAFQGLCVPKECDKEDIETKVLEVIPQIQKSLTSMQFDVEIRYPLDQYSDQINITAILLIAFTCILILSTFVFQIFYKKQVKDSAYKKFFHNFDIYTNFKKLIQTTPNKQNPRLDILNGIRVLSICWIIYGHTFYYHIYGPVQNVTQAILDIKTFVFQLLPSAPFAVDTFFYLSGFLMVYSLLPELKKKANLMKILILYIHRYLRIMPLYVFCIFFSWYVVPYFGNGPIWSEYKKNFDNYCTKYVWTNILMINNFLPVSGPSPCFGWSWYLANDFQFFLVVPFFILLYLKNKTAGIFGFLLALISCFITAIILSIQNDYKATLGINSSSFDYLSHYYLKPYTRAPAFIIGSMAGLYYLENFSRKNEPIFGNGYNHPLKRLAIFLGGIFLMFFIVFIPYNGYNNEWPQALHVIYIVFSRPIFTLGLSFMIIPCLFGHYRKFSVLLGGSLWSPLAKMTFGIYLVHPIYILYTALSSRQAYYFNQSVLFLNFLSILVMSGFTSFILCLIVEVPFMNLEKNYFLPLFRRNNRKLSDLEAKLIIKEDSIDSLKQTHDQRKETVGNQITFNSQLFLLQWII